MKLKLPETLEKRIRRCHISGRQTIFGLAAAGILGIAYYIYSPTNLGVRENCKIRTWHDSEYITSDARIFYDVIQEKCPDRTVSYRMDSEGNLSAVMIETQEKTQEFGREEIRTDYQERFNRLRAWVEREKGK